MRAGARKPDISSLEALKRSLLAADSVAHSKQGASGLYFAGDYRLRERTPGADVDVCFSGSIAVTPVRLL